MPRDVPNALVPPLRNVVAMLHVASVSRTAAFYALLGFEVANTHYEPACDDEPVWAWLQSRHVASLMVAHHHEVSAQRLQGTDGVDQRFALGH